MFLWIQECPACGYVNRDIDEPSHLSRETLVEFLRSDAYRDCDGVALPDEKTKQFYRFFMQSREAMGGDIMTEREPSKALLEDCFWGLKCCAWGCDDAGMQYAPIAAKIRRMAIPYLYRTISFLKVSQEDTAARILILADFYRRSRQFAQVSAFLNAHILQQLPKGLMQSIAQFQLWRAEAEDDQCYLISDAVDKFG